MEGCVMVDNGRLTEKEARLNMEQCADFLARMIQKYGPEILAELKEKDVKHINSCNSPAYKSGYPRHNERTADCVTMGIRKGERS